MQTIIIGVRFISILMFIIGAIYLICANGVQDLSPPGEGVFNFNHFVDIFSNSVFSFMFHHSFPSIALSLKSSEEIAFVGRMGFLISGFILLILPLTASMAFGASLDPGGGFVYYNFDFEYSIPAVYWVTSFYVFLNIAAFSVYIIVIRTYILKVTYPAVNPRTISSTLFSIFRTYTNILNHHSDISLDSKFFPKRSDPNRIRFYRRYFWNNDIVFDAINVGLEGKKNAIQ